MLYKDPDLVSLQEIAKRQKQTIKTIQEGLLRNRHIYANDTIRSILVDINLQTAVLEHINQAIKLLKKVAANE